MAAVNFRLATPVGQPLQVAPTDQARDIAHALAWLVKNAGEHEIATEPVWQCASPPARRVAFGQQDWSLRAGSTFFKLMTAMVMANQQMNRPAKSVVSKLRGIPSSAEVTTSGQSFVVVR